jgi:RND superfamily putative drug exporter
MVAPSKHPPEVLDRMHAAYSALGRFTVKYRWFVLVAWLVVIFGSFSVFPSLTSVVKANNSDFLPKSSPSTIASNLASPLQNANLTPVPVVVSQRNGKLTNADALYVQQLVTVLSKVKHVTQVRDLGTSPDGVANQIQTLSNINLGQDGPSKTLVDDLRTAIHGLRAPPGVQTNVAGQLADQVDQEAKSGNTAEQVQLLSVVFILILLIIIFRSPLAPLITLLPALLISQFAGRVVAELTHAGLQVSSLSQIMLIILVLGAGTDYALFLIFRVREEIRSGMPPRDAIVRSVERVGESITFSAGTVRDLRHLLEPRCSAGDRDLPDAAGRVDAAAGVARDLWPSRVLAGQAQARSERQAAVVGSRRRTGDRAPGTDPGRGSRRVRRLGDRRDRLQPGRIRQHRRGAEGHRRPRR